MILCYLGCPYSHPDARTRHWRFLMASTAAVELARRGFAVYSSITSTYPMELVVGQDDPELGYEYWMQMGDVFLKLSRHFFILKLPNWEESEGVKRELANFKKYHPKLPVEYLEPPKLPPIMHNWQMPFDLGG